MPSDPLDMHARMGNEVLKGLYEDRIKIRLPLN